MYCECGSKTKLKEIDINTICGNKLLIIRNIEAQECIKCGKRILEKNAILKVSEAWTNNVQIQKQI